MFISRKYKKKNINALKLLGEIYFIKVIVKENKFFIIVAFNVNLV